MPKKYKRFAPLFPSLPLEELNRRIATDAMIARLKRELAKAEERYNDVWKVFDARVERLRVAFSQTRRVLWAAEVLKTYAGRIRNRERELASRVSRECYIKQNQAHVDQGDRGKHWARKRQEGFDLQAKMQKMREAKEAKANTNTTPPHEVTERQSNGSLESPHLDGARNPDADNKVPEQG